MNEAGRENLDLRHYLRLVWRRKWILLAVIVAIPTAVYLISSSKPKVYEASTVLEVRETVTTLSTGLSFSASGAKEAERLIQTTRVAEAAAKELGESPNTAGSLLGQISVFTDESEETGFLTITARNEDPERAADVANAFGGAITGTRTDDALTEVNQQIATLEAQQGGSDSATREALAQQVQELRAMRASLTDTTGVIEPAFAPSTPISPHPGRNTRVAFILALLIAAGLVPLLELFDRRLRDPDELQELTETPLLGTIPENAFPGGVPGPNVPEAFQTLRAGLTYFNIDNTLSSVMITSPGRGDGKTTVATNLAIALAQDGKDVILVDGDLRRPQVASRLGLADEVNFGIDAVLAEKRSLTQALLDFEVEGGRLRVLPGGAPPPNPSVLLGSDRMRELLAKLSEHADIVIIDTPPLLAVSDAIPLLEQVAGTVVVARMDRTSRDGLLKARHTIATARGNLLGVVATGIRTGGISGYDGYGYGYAYGEGDGEGVSSNGAKRRRLRLGRGA